MQENKKHIGNFPASVQENKEVFGNVLASVRENGKHVGNSPASVRETPKKPFLHAAHSAHQPLEHSSHPDTELVSLGAYGIGAKGVGGMFA